MPSDTRTRLRRGQAARAAEGGYPGGPLPYALRIDEWGRWERVPEEQETLQRIAWLRAQGMSIYAIAQRLDALGVPTQKGGTWRPTTVLKILTNPIYYRTIKHISPNLEGHARKRAEYNYTTTGILAHIQRLAAAS